MKTAAPLSHQTLVIIVGPLHVSASEDGRPIGRWGNLLAHLPEYAMTWEEGATVCLHALWDDATSRWEAQQLTRISQGSGQAPAVVGENNPVYQDSGAHQNQNNAAEPDADVLDDNPFAGVGEDSQNDTVTSATTPSTRTASRAPALGAKPKFSFGTKSATSQTATNNIAQAQPQPAAPKQDAPKQENRPYAAPLPARAVFASKSVTQMTANPAAVPSPQPAQNVVPIMDNFADYEDDIPF